MDDPGNAARGECLFDRYLVSITGFWFGFHDDV